MNMYRKLYAGAFVALAGTSACFAQVTLPTTGVDVGEYISAGITAVATVIGVAVGGFVSFLVVRKGLKWCSRGLG
jgi:uncharacterized membrane protein